MKIIITPLPLDACLRVAASAKAGGRIEVGVDMAYSPRPLLSESEALQGRRPPGEKVDNWDYFLRNPKYQCSNDQNDMSSLIWFLWFFWFLWLTKQTKETKETI
jgi:hypothetical protein